MKKILLSIITATSLMWGGVEVSAQKPLQEAPVVILGQESEVTLKNTAPFEISLDDLVVYLPAGVEESQLRLNISSGQNYWAEGTKIIPGSKTLGEMNIPLTITYGSYTTPVFTYKAVVRSAEVFTSIRLFVSADGDDAASGAMDKPLRTIPRALEVMREMRKTEADRQSGDFEILLLEGEYEVSEPIEIGYYDRGYDYAHLTIKPYGDDKVIICGETCYNDNIFNLLSTEYICLENLELRNSGATAISMQHASSDNEVRNCKINNVNIGVKVYGYNNLIKSTSFRSLTSYAVDLSGGDRPSSNYARNRVDMCDLGNFSVKIDGVGQILTNTTCGKQSIINGSHHVIEK